MSLVNDALRRAQDAQKKNQPAPPGPQFRPAEPAPAQKRGMGIWVATITVFAAIMAASILWHGWLQTSPVHATVQPKPAEGVAPTVAVPETKPPVQTVVASTPAPITPVAVAETPAPAPVATASAPQLKLQAIFYSPGHSSAIINGKTVRVGDNFRGFRIAAMTQTSATLVSAMQTNVMTLNQD